MTEASSIQPRVSPALRLRRLKRHLLRYSGLRPLSRGLWPLKKRVLKLCGLRPLKKIVFVSYGAFDCNSAGHIAGFANALSHQGYTVAACGRDQIFNAYAFGRTPFEFFRVQDLMDDVEGVIGFDGSFEPDQTMMLCWTPRKVSRRAVALAYRTHQIPYVVHFEDNEELLSQFRLGVDGTQADRAADEAAAQDRAKRDTFLRKASGATVIEGRITQILPPSLPTLLLEPGVDSGLLGEPMSPLRRATLLRAAGAPETAKVIVYPGNIHRVNLADMAGLYGAVRLLREQGHEVVLIKTGKDDEQLATAAGLGPQSPGVLTLGQVERCMLVDLLKCADVFVQPGAPGPFNDYRLPSKLPEFFAVGRPVVLPATNVGLRLRDGIDALLLHNGSAEEIARCVGRVFDDDVLAGRLAANARAFARRTYRWDVQARKLAQFLEQTHQTRLR